MSLEDAGSNGKGFSQGPQALELRVAHLLSHITKNIIEPTGPLNDRARKILNLLGEERVSGYTTKLLREARGYTQTSVANPDYKDARSTVLHREEGAFAEFLVDNPFIAKIIDPSGEHRKYLPYLSYLKVEVDEFDRYMSHIRTMTGSKKASAWAFGRKEGVTAAIASGAIASGASGQGAPAIFLECSAALYYMGAIAWDRFQLSRAYEHMATVLPREEREVGLSALLKALGKEPDLYGM